MLRSERDVDEWEVRGAQPAAVPSAFVTIVRGWAQPQKKLTSGYEFSGVEPHSWATARGSVWYRSAIREAIGSELNVMEPGEVCNVTMIVSAIDFRVLIVESEFVAGVLEDALVKSPHLRPGAFREDELLAMLLRGSKMLPWTISSANVWSAMSF